MSLLPVDQAIDLFLKHAVPITETEVVAIEACLGRVLASDQISSINVPPYDASAMDGYALRAEDLPSEKGLLVTQRIPAGSVGKPIGPGEAARIFTGAPLPEGANAVLMQEECSIEGDRVFTNFSVQNAQYVSQQGQDLKQGQNILAKGVRLRAEHLGMLASVGIAEIEVFRPLKVAVLTTGSEIVQPGLGLKPGQIYNSNRFVMSGLIQGLGLELCFGAIVVDDPLVTERALLEASNKADCIITTGGVSVGEEDYVQSSIEKLGSLQVSKMAMKPGKPVTFGEVQGVPVFGLPGNPSSVYIGFCVLVKPFLLKQQGGTEYKNLSINLPAGFSVTKPGTRQEYLRAQVVDHEEYGQAIRKHDNQSSGMLSSLSWANGLAVIPVGVTIKEGDKVEFIFLNELVS